MAGDAIVHVVPVRRRLMAAAGLVHMARVMATAADGLRCSGRGSRLIPRSRARRNDLRADDGDVRRGDSRYGPLLRETLRFQRGLATAGINGAELTVLQAP